MPIGSGTNFAETPGMGLKKPTPGICGPLGVEPPGTSWLELQNAAFDLLDAHTHAPGFGSPIPTAGLNINADLSFNSFNAKDLRTARFAPIALSSLSGSDLGCLVVADGDLYFVDGTGQKVRLTSTGSSTAGPGTIDGLAVPAAV